MNISISQIANRLLESYKKFGFLNEMEENSFPNRLEVQKICEGLLELLFPRFFNETPIAYYPIRSLTKSRVAVLEKQLQIELYKSLVSSSVAVTAATLAEGNALTRKEASIHEAQQICARFFDQLFTIQELLHSDIEAAFEGDPAAQSHDEIVASYPYIIAISIQRLAHVLHKERIPMLPRMMTEWAHSTTGIDIHPGARIGSHFFIDHGTGVVIGETCVIGNHVKLYHGVTLGARSFEKDEQGRIVKSGKRHPNVEDHVTIYPNSTVLGGDTTIGAHSTIGGNVFLLHSVPANSLVYYEETQLKIIPKRSARERASQQSKQNAAEDSYIPMFEI